MKRLLMLSVLSLGLAFAGAAQAGVATGTLNVSMNMLADCTVTTTPVNFGNVARGTYHANGDVTVNCSSGLPYSIALDSGQNYVGYAREMINDGGTMYVPYWLYKDSGYTTEWADIDHAGTYPMGTSLADTGTGADQPHPVYGEVSIYGSELNGNYADVVNVSVYY